MDNFPEFCPKQNTGPRHCRQLFVGGLSSRDQHHPTDLEERDAQLRDDWQRTQRSCSGHVKGLPIGPSPIVLKATVNYLDVVHAKAASRRGDPIHSPSMRIYQRERGLRKRHREGQPW